MIYQIGTEFPQQQFLQIKAEFNVSQDILQLNFPAWRPGRYELGNFAKNIRSFKVFDELGKPLMFSKSLKDSWSVECMGAKKVVVQYSYYAAELNAGSTFLDETMVYINPINCLVFEKGKENESCVLRITPAKQLFYSGTLPLNNGEIHAANFHELVDSPFVFSNDYSTNGFNYKGVDFKITFFGVHEVPWDRVLNDFQKFTKKQMDDFGAFPVKQFHFMILTTANAHYHGVEHKESTIIVLGPALEVFDGLYDELLGVSSHELYHVWNVKSLRSVDLWPYDYTQENYSRMGYLCEGITTYFGDHYLMTSGVWNVDRYLKEFTQVIQKHIDNQGRFNYSLAESSFDTWLDGYVAGVPSRKVSIYNEGALLAFITDIFIRSHTNAKKSLKDLMSQLYKNCYLKGRGATENDFVDSVNTLAEADYRELFEAIVFKRASYEGFIVDALNNLGFDLTHNSNPDLVASRLGLKTSFVGGYHQVSAIIPGSGADLSGLMIGDKIWAVNHLVVDGKMESAVKNFENESLKFTVNRRGVVVELIFPEAHGDYNKQVKVNKLEIPSNHALLIFRYWSGVKVWKPSRSKIG